MIGELTINKYMNNQEEKSKCLKIPLSRKGFAKQDYALIDLEDYSRVSNFKWYFTDRYIRAVMYGNTISLHRFILNYFGTKDVDHINGNTLDNRKANLRICSHSRNIINSKKRKDNTSGITGVYWDKTNKKWVAKITVSNKLKTLGCFKNKDKAIVCRTKAVKKYYKEFKPNDK